MRLKPIVIAHRGASGYLPEHTLAAKTLAHAMGADYLEQDLVLTQDDELVVLHDHYLDRVTDVTQVFPNRARADGRFYALDFTLAEIRQLNVSEGFTINPDGSPQANFPNRFPLGKSRFQVPTLAEEIELIQGLNKTLNRTAGIYPEIKSPWWHHQQNRDISRLTLQTLKDYGYTKRSSPIYLQCFDPHELKRIKYELLPEFDMDIKLIQLIAHTNWQETYEQIDGRWRVYDYNWMLKPQAMPEIAHYADGIGPWLPMLHDDQGRFNDLVAAAHEAGLHVHPYTLRCEQLPAFAKNFEQLLDQVYNRGQVDGVFTDFPDKAAHFLRRQPND